MDVGRALSVLWRFRFLVVAGVIVALALAFLAYVRVSLTDGSVQLSHRSSETWESRALLFVTESGFPWGRSVTQDPQPVGDDVTVIEPPRFAETDRFESLAALYAALAEGDPVKQLMLADGPIAGTISAAPVMTTELLARENQPQQRSFDLLPLVRLTAQAATPQQATELVSRQLRAFQTFLEQQQDASKIPEEDRVLMTVLEQPGEAILAEGRSNVYPVMVAVVLIGATILLAFILENVRPRGRSAAKADDDVLPVLAPRRRSAEGAER